MGNKRMRGTSKNAKTKGVMIFKYNEDDILEILTEYLAENNGFGTFSSHGLLLGTPGKDLRLMAVVGELEDDEVVRIDLEDIDRTMEYNGTHRD